MLPKRTCIDIYYDIQCVKLKSNQMISTLSYNQFFSFTLRIIVSDYNGEGIPKLSGPAKPTTNPSFQMSKCKGQSSLKYLQYCTPIEPAKPSQGLEYPQIDQSKCPAKAGAVSKILMD